MFSTVFVVDGFGRRQFVADTLAGLSAEWSAFRDQTDIGNSDIRSGGVVMGPLADGFGECAYISYNGKVWRNSEAWNGEEPLYNPYA